MKRLVDESTDELTRSLLVAGIEHRPGPGSKARVIVALGAGSALGLFSSNAFAWLGTTAGKLTAAGVAVGVAGTVFIAGPRLLRDEPVRTPQSSSTATGSQVLKFQEPPLSGSPSAPGAASDPGESHASGSSIADRGIAEKGVAEGGLAEGRVDERPASTSGKTATRKLSAWRERRLAARRKAAQQRGAEGDEPAVLAAAKPGPALSTPSVGELAPRGLDQPGADPIGVEPLQKKANLDAEVRLVDEMHWAARHNDHEALGRFVERYHETFPDGQLKNEVAQFAARLQRSEPPRSR